jgi:hypothetical protein
MDITLSTPEGTAVLLASVDGFSRSPLKFPLALGGSLSAQALTFQVFILEALQL